jgi:putative flippase GtrA
MAEFRRFVRFVIAGTAATGINYGTFAALYWIGLNYLLAAGSAYAVSILVGFALNRFFVFRKPSPNRNALLRYFGLYIGSLVANLIILESLVSLMGLDPLLANAIALMILVAVNFVLVRRLVFPRDSGKPDRNHSD